MSSDTAIPAHATQTESLGRDEVSGLLALDIVLAVVLGCAALRIGGGLGLRLVCTWCSGYVWRRASISIISIWRSISIRRAMSAPLRFRRPIQAGSSIR